MDDPFRLQVHPAIDIPLPTGKPALPPLPKYVARDHDEQLGEIVRQAIGGRSTIAVLIGGPSTGKTRAYWEAIQALPPEWRLWRPDPTRPNAVRKNLRLVVPRTVIWLNQSNEYLLTTTAAGDKVAAALTELLLNRDKAPVLVLGTLWEEYFFTLTAGPGETDPHSQARELLKGTAIRVPPAFKGPDLAAFNAVAADDPRLAFAAKNAEEGQIAQYLAGAPALLERYHTAPAPARALIKAAMDARRLGHGLALPQAFLEEAAHGYLTAQEMDEAGDRWLDSALEKATAPCRGARGPITRICSGPGIPAPTQPHYRLADYLEHHARHTRKLLCPPAAFWDAALRYAATSEDQRSFANAANSRFRYRYSVRLWQRAIEASNTGALVDMARWREEQGDHTQSEALLHHAAMAGNALALWEWAERKKGGWDHDEAERLARLVADTAGAELLYALACLWEKTGDDNGAPFLLKRAADAGSANARWKLAEQRRMAGDHKKAESLLRAAADAGKADAIWALAKRRRIAGDIVGAARDLRIAAEAGNPDVLRDLVQRWEAGGHHSGAERLARLLADAGNTYALEDLALRRDEVGAYAEAERLARLAASVGRFGSANALLTLARRQADRNDYVTAKRLLDAAVDAGDTVVLHAMARRKEKADDPAEAERLARLAAIAGSTEALGTLVLWRDEAGDPAEAERLAHLGPVAKVDLGRG